MAETGLSGAELLAWNGRTFGKWMEMAERTPAMLYVPCDVYGVSNLGELLKHVVAVELRFGERLCDETPSNYEDIRADVAALRVAHGGMVERVRRLLADPAYDWNEVIAIQTRTMGVVRASRKTALIHLLMHSIRHYAQAATLARQAGFKPDWPMDYLAMGAVA